MRKIALLLPLALAVAAMIVIALTQQHQPDIAEATDDKIDLDFIIVANPGDVVGTTWTEAQVKDLISGANAIYAANSANIFFNWPKQDSTQPFKFIDDPQKTVGGPGDVKVPPLTGQVPYLGEHLGAGEAAGVSTDPKDPAEAEIICNNAWANANPGMLPVALVQHFTDLTGAKASLLGVAYTNIGTNQPGYCILMSVQAKNNPQTFAHELGHVLCLGHVDKVNNLMEPIKAPGGTLLNPGQVGLLCPKQMQAKVLEQQPGAKIPTPNLTPTPVKGPDVSALCRPKTGPDDPTKCKYDLFQSFTILGDANFAQDTDKNGTAGYHGVDVQVTWPPGLGDVEKSSDMFCPPGGQAGKLPILVTGQWTGTCGLQTQDDPAKIPPCPIQPDEPFPAPGCDTFDSYAAFDINLTNPALGVLDCQVSGATQVTRGPVGDSIGPNGLDDIPTEIVYMHLTGLCNPGAIPITVFESSVFDSTGYIEEQANAIPGTLEFPANSFFDVFVDVQTPIGTYHNDVAIDMSCKIGGIPPFLCPYGSTLTPNLFDDSADHKLVGTIQHSLHVPKKTLEGLSLYEIELTCAEVGSFTVNVSATFTREAKDTVGPAADSVDINCTAPLKQAWPGDTDGDGCPDANENQPKSAVANGGGRDYLDPYDWYDVNQDGIIDLFFDILGVIQHYSLDGSPPYAVAYDRGPPPLGANPWKMTAPDNSIDLFFDILGVIKQYTLKGCTVDPGA